jgi:hypothetical protein
MLNGPKITFEANQNRKVIFLRDTIPEPSKTPNPHQTRGLLKSKTKKRAGWLGAGAICTWRFFFFVLVALVEMEPSNGP